MKALSISSAKKQAKQLKNQAVLVEAEACARIRRVYAKFEHLTDEELADVVCLGHAQHAIAKENGYVCWKDMVRRV